MDPLRRDDCLSLYEASAKALAIYSIHVTLQGLRPVPMI
jgi:hypothetical protein